MILTGIVIVVGFVYHLNFCRNYFESIKNRRNGANYTLLDSIEDQEITNER